jgi:hypothetical protein
MLKSTLRIIFPLISCLVIFGCAHPAPSTSDAPGTVSHVVLVWLKEPADAATRRRVIDATHSFKQIPGVLRVNAGAPVPGTRPVVDSSFHVGLVITFKNVEALRAYDPHPIHQKAVAEVLRPVAEKFVVYDVINP